MFPSPGTLAGHPLDWMGEAPSLSSFLHPQCDQLPALCWLLTMALSDIPGNVGKGRGRRERGRGHLCMCVHVCNTVVFSGCMCTDVLNPASRPYTPEEYEVTPLTPPFFSRTGSSRCYPDRTITPSTTKGQSHPDPPGERNPWEGKPNLGRGRDQRRVFMRSEPIAISSSSLPNSKGMGLPNSTSSSRS